MKNKILALSLSAIFLMISPVYAQSRSCSAINYDALESINDGQFDAKKWLNQANLYAKQSNDPEALNQGLYLYVNLIQDSSIEPEIVLEAFQGVNQLLTQQNSSVDMSCIMGKFLNLSKSYLEASQMEFLDMKPDARIIDEVKDYGTFFVSFEVPDDLDMNTLLILSNWKNPTATAQLKLRAQDAGLVYQKLLQERLAGDQETIETFDELNQAMGKFTDAEKVELYKILSFYEYHTDEAIKAKSIEMVRQLLVDNPHIVEFQSQLGSYSHRDLCGLALLRPIVNETSSIESQIILASLLYQASDYQASYQLLKKLADEGQRSALASLVSDLFMYQKEIPLSNDEIMAWVNKADALYQKTHDPELVEALYRVYNHRIIADADYEKFISYIRVSLFTEFYLFLEERHNLYRDLQEYAKLMENIQALIINDDKEALIKLWENDRYSSIFHSPKILKQMADMDISQAQFLLALDYEKEHKLAEAIQYFLKAADNGNENAKMAMTYAYMRGEGVEQNREKAIHYFNLAHKDNNKDSGYGSYEKLQYVYPTMYQWMKEDPNEEAIMYLDQQKYFYQSIHLDKDAPMFFIMEDVEKL